jgi:hypothetical protein
MESVSLYQLKVNETDTSVFENQGNEFQVSLHKSFLPCPTQGNNSGILNLLQSKNVQPLSSPSK